MKRKSNILTRLASAALLAFMLMTALPVTALAEETAGVDTPTAYEGGAAANQAEDTAAAAPTEIDISGAESGTTAAQPDGSSSEAVTESSENVADAESGTTAAQTEDSSPEAVTEYSENVAVAESATTAGQTKGSSPEAVTEYSENVADAESNASAELITDEAKGSVEAGGTTSPAETENEEVSSDGNVGATPPFETDKSDSNEGVDDEATDGTEETENVFAIVYGEIMKNAGDIFSTLAFISSLLIAIAYKKGLLPALSRAVSGIEGAIDKVKRTADESREAVGERHGEMLEKLMSLDGKLSEFSRSIDGVEKRLEALTADSDTKESIKLIMSSQIDLLYDVFMCSSLPQYQKDAVGNRVSKMKAELNKNA